MVSKGQGVGAAVCNRDGASGRPAAALSALFLVLACSTPDRAFSDGASGSGGTSGSSGAAGSSSNNAGSGGHAGKANGGTDSSGAGEDTSGGTSTEDLGGAPATDGGSDSGGTDNPPGDGGAGPIDGPEDCPALTDPTNGVIDTRDTTPGTVATVSCMSGYGVSGEATLTCEDDGKWSDDEPTCALKDCGPLTDPADGSVSAPKTTFGSTATYSCMTGYGPSGSSTRTCGADGKWSGTQPTCVIANCPALPSPDRGTVAAPTLTYNSTATYKCNAGSTLNGVATRTCQPSGAWSGSAPTCEVVDCGSPNPLGNGSVTASSTTYSSIATYKCKTGYNLTGSTSLTCQASGDWGGGTAPSCALKDCGALTNPSHGTVNASTTTYGATATYSCSSGYGLSGSATRQCGDDGKWSGSAPTCPAKDCGALAAPANGSISAATTTFGATATYSCRAGYKISGAATRTCDASGNWTGAQAGCTRNSCLGGGDGANLSCGGVGGDCCDRLPVPGGTFNRGNDSGNPATVSAFSLDKFEVTVGRFRAFVNAGFGTKLKPPTGADWSSSYNDGLEPDTATFKSDLDNASESTWAASDDILPMNDVTWYEALAFCIWDGGRLPTALQWDYAATGGSDQRKYPWGNQDPGADTKLAVYGCFYGTSANCYEVGHMAWVGWSDGDKGRWGHRDLGGSMSELVRDWTGNYPTAPHVCTDCANLTVTQAPQMIVMGGEFSSDASRMVSPALGSTVAVFRDYNVGFRCASSTP